MTRDSDSLPGARPFSFSAPEAGPKGAGPTNGGEDPCHAADFEHLIGQPVPDAETLAALEGPARVRVIAPGDMVTMDHLPQRLNIETDGGGIVLRLRCG